MFYTCRLKRTAVGLSNRAADGEPEPHSGGLAGGERLEQTFAHRRREARAIVCDDEAHMSIIIPVGTDRNSTPDLSRCCQRLNRIGEQIAQNYLDLQPIDEERWQ